MAKRSTNKRIIKCTKCNKELVESNFYNTNSMLSTSGKLEICKKCLQDMIDMNNINSVYKVLQLIDKPFLYNYWEKAKISKPDNPFGAYITMANSGLNEFKNANYQDSVFQNSTPTHTQSKTQSLEDIENDLLSDFKPSKDMMLRWGTRYAPEQYIKLENFYHDMKLKNNIETPQEEDYLKKLAVISLKLDEELEAGNYSQAKSLGDLFSKYMADSKFRTMDKTEADKTGGIRNFSMIYAEVESDDFIPPWEHYRKIKGL